MLKYEIILTIWEDDLYKGRIRVFSDDHIELLNEVEEKLKELQSKIADDKIKKITIDDDIPF